MSGVERYGWHYARLFNIAKLLERCSDGVEDQGAGEASRGIKKINHVSLRAFLRASGSRFSAARPLPP